MLVLMLPVTCTVLACCMHVYFSVYLHIPSSLQGKDALFLETAMQFGKKRHARIDVIPMDKEEAMDAPLYFRKAIMDAGE